MAKRTLFWSSLLLLFLFLSIGVAAQPPAPRSDEALVGQEFAPDQLLIRFRPGVTAKQMQVILQGHGVARIHRVRGIDVDVLRLPPGLTVARAVELFSHLPEVAFAEPNYVLRVQAPLREEIADQWGLQKIRAEQAWDLVPLEGTALIAVVDTGINRGHPDLSGNVWTNPGEIAGNGVDDDGNGYIDDTWGWDFQNGDNDPSDDHMHGTAVSSVAAGIVGNGGVAGVCPMCQLMAVKVLSADGSALLSTVADGIAYAADNGAQVINLSLGGPTGAAALQSAVDNAWTQGALVVAAAGNDGSETIFYPAGYDNALAVASTNQDDYHSCFSNYGDGFVSVAAPGESVLSADLSEDGFGTYSGTSLSTPHVSGLGGLLFAQDPSRTNTVIRTLIVSTTVDLGPAGSDAFFGTGRVDAVAALGGDPLPPVPPAGLVTDDLSASGFAHARKLARDANGTLHLVWHGRGNEPYGIWYAFSTDEGVTWSPPEALFESSAETYHSALALYDGDVYVAFPSKDGSTTDQYRVFFTRKPAGGTWSAPVAVTEDGYDAVRPDLYADPSNGKLHLVAASFDNAPYVYYTASEDGGTTWTAVAQIQAGPSASYTRYADVHANGANVYVAGRSVELLFGLLPNFRLFALRSTDGGVTWEAPTELQTYFGLLSGEYGASLAGTGDALYLAYEHSGGIYVRSSSGGAAWSEAVSIGAGAWPSISQADDGQAWLMFTVTDTVRLQHYTGATWEPAEIVYERNRSYPNLKLGTNGGRVEWVTTYCSGAPFRLEYGARTLGPADASPTVAVTDPSQDQVIGGAYRVLVSAGDDNELSTVEFSIDGAAYLDITSNFDGTHYFYDWNTVAYADGVHTLQARATDDAAQSTTSGLISVTVENVNDPPFGTDDSGATSEDAPLVVAAPGILGNDGDPEGDPLTVSAVNGNAADVGREIGLDSGARLTVNADGGYAYDPNGQFEDLPVGDQAHDSFSYTLSDGSGGTDTASVDITVTGANDPPEATNDSASVDEDGSVDITVLGNDSDVDLDHLSLTSVGRPDHGTATVIDDVAVRYVPARDYCGPDNFGYTISDGNGGTATAAVSVQVACINDAPEAVFTFDCSFLTCTFDASGSQDVDGSIVGYAWDFGDGNTGNGMAATNEYAAAGSYTVLLTVTDDGDATGTATQEITVSSPPPPTMHIGDLDGDCNPKKNKWTAIATINVHDAAHDPVPGAMVSGTWSDGTTGASVCVTDALGQCTVSKGGISSRNVSVRFTVGDVTHPTLAYAPDANHDPDGDSEGTYIIVNLAPRAELLPPPESEPQCHGVVCISRAGSIESAIPPSNPDAVSDVYGAIRTVTDDGEATAVVTILDDDGNPLEGATVYGTWSGVYVVTVKAVTGPDGSVSFKSGKVREGGATFTFAMHDGGLDVNASGESGMP